MFWRSFDLFALAGSSTRVQLGKSSARSLQRQTLPTYLKSWKLLRLSACVAGSSGISWHVKQCQAISWAQTEVSSRFTYARELLVKIHRPLT